MVSEFKEEDYQPTLDGFGQSTDFWMETFLAGDGPSRSKLSNIWIMLCLRDRVTNDWRCFEWRPLPNFTSIALKWFWMARPISGVASSSICKETITGDQCDPDLLGKHKKTHQNRTTRQHRESVTSSVHVTLYAHGVLLFQVQPLIPDSNQSRVDPI